MLKAGTRENRTFNMLKAAHYFPASSPDVNYNELYDLQEDPYEDHNAYNDPQYQNIIKQMKKEMMRLRTETGDTDASRPVMLDILRAQGL